MFFAHPISVSLLIFSSSVLSFTFSYSVSVLPFFFNHFLPPFWFLYFPLSFFLLRLFSLLMNFFVSLSILPLLLFVLYLSPFFLLCFSFLPSFLFLSRYAYPFLQTKHLSMPYDYECTFTFPSLDSTLNIIKFLFKIFMS